MIIREAIIYRGSSDPVLSRPPESRPDDPFGYDGSIDDIVSPRASLFAEVCGGARGMRIQKSGELGCRLY
jgi:hypothetical protein